MVQSPEIHVFHSHTHDLSNYLNVFLQITCDCLTYALFTHRLLWRIKARHCLQLSITHKVLYNRSDIISQLKRTFVPCQGKRGGRLCRVFSGQSAKSVCTVQTYSSEFGQNCFVLFFPIVENAYSSKFNMFPKTLHYKFINYIYKFILIMKYYRTLFSNHILNGADFVQYFTPSASPPCFTNGLGLFAVK